MALPRHVTLPPCGKVTLSNSVHGLYVRENHYVWRWKMESFGDLTELEKGERGKTIPDQSFPTLCSSNLFVRKKLTNLPRSKSFHSLDCDAYFEKTFEF